MSNRSRGLRSGCGLRPCRLRSRLALGVIPIDMQFQHERLKGA